MTMEEYSMSGNRRMIRVATFAAAMLLAAVVAGWGCSDDDTDGETPDSGWNVGQGDVEYGDVDNGDGGADATDDDTSDADIEPAEECFDYEDSGACHADEQCQWQTTTMCDGEVVGGCFEEGMAPAPPVCDVEPEDCQDLTTENSCETGPCDWLHPGCGPEGEGIELDHPTCVAGGHCDDDSDCPGELSCETLWIDPCVDSPCEACGGEALRCWRQD